MPIRLSSVRAAECGLSTVRGLAASGLSAASGSVSKVSSPAAQSCPASSAAATAASSRMPPRAVLSTMARGGRRAISRAPMRFLGLRPERDVDADHVRLPEAIVELVHEDGLGRGGPVRERVEGHDAHPEGARPRRDLATDPPEADHQQGAAPQLQPDHPGARREVATADRGIERDAVLRGREQEEQGLLGDRHGVDVADHRDRKPARRTVVDRDVVVSDAVAGHDLEARRRLQYLHRQGARRGWSARRASPMWRRMLSGETSVTTSNATSSRASKSRSASGRKG